MRAAGASLREPIDWHKIKWNKVNRNVRRLQVRIVKALREGKPRLVRALQYILTRSFGGRALAPPRAGELTEKSGTILTRASPATQTILNDNASALML